MPRKRTTAAAEEALLPSEEKDTITVSIEVSKRTYDSMISAAKACGFTLDEWLAEVIQDSV